MSGWRHRRRAPRPDTVFDHRLQHERTALSWERTAIGIIVAGVLLARYAAENFHFWLASVGMAVVVFGAGLLVWTGVHYDDLHGPLRAGESPTRPGAARIVGKVVIVVTGFATCLALVLAFDG